MAHDRPARRCVANEIFRWIERVLIDRYYILFMRDHRAVISDTVQWKSIVWSLKKFDEFFFFVFFFYEDT